MSTKKKIAFVTVLVVAVGSIWYLESLKAHPAGGAPSGQEIAVNELLAQSSTDAMAGAATGTNTGAGTMSEGENSGHAGTSSSGEVIALARLAASDKAAGDQAAIEIAGPTGFVNVAPGFKLSSLVGNHVVLLDFWTYSCINCVRTLPYLNAWYEKYAPYGLVVVGIHTPEFDFEKDITNVKSAVAQYGIHYPVVLDSDQATWNAYDNLYWPHEYLIDMAGYVVHDQVGEGNYSQTEAEIQRLLVARAGILGLDASAIPTSTVGIAPQNLSDSSSPETYFGAARNSPLANGEYFTNGTQKLTLPSPDSVKQNYLYLGGTWDFEDQYAKSMTAGAGIIYRYDAGHVYIVASGAANGTVVDVLQDGKPISNADAGSDVHDGTVMIGAHKLYNLVNNATGGGVHTLQLIIESAGLQAYTFTFG